MAVTLASAHCCCDADAKPSKIKGILIHARWPFKDNGSFRIDFFMVILFALPELGDVDKNFVTVTCDPQFSFAGRESSFDSELQHMRNIHVEKLRRYFQLIFIVHTTTFQTLHTR